jgi:hypothetical protein
MLSLLLAVYQVSTLVLNGVTLGALLGLAVILLILLNRGIKHRLQTALQPLLRPHERIRAIATLLVLSLTLIFLSLVIEGSFQFGGEASRIEVTVESIHPARLGSPVFSMKLSVPPHKLNFWRGGSSFVRYDSKKTADAFLMSQKIPMVLQQGALGLSRLRPLPGNECLHGDAFSY